MWHDIMIWCYTGAAIAIVVSILAACYCFVSLLLDIRRMR